MSNRVTKKTAAQLDAEIAEALAGEHHATMAAPGAPGAKKIAKDLEAAVRAAQLYSGKGLTMRIADEQKLYNSMNRKIAAVAKRRGMDEAFAYQQIMGEAKRRGGIQATPGRDI